MGDDNHLVLQHLNRLQNTNDVRFRTRRPATSYPSTKINDAWVEVVQRMDFTANGEELVWLSEKDGYPRNTTWLAWSGPMTTISSFSI